MMRHVRTRGAADTPASLGEQLDAAAGMADAHDEDMEAVLPGWVQPAGIM